MIAPQRNASVTSAALSKISERTDLAAGRRQDRAWQGRAYELLDEVGELGYLMQLKASLLARCDFSREYLNDDGVWDTVPDDDKGPGRVMNAFVGPQGGQTELKRQAALHLSTAGEATLLGTTIDGGDHGILWEFLSVDELTITSDGRVQRQRGRHQAVETLEPDAHYVARAWRPSARRSDEPDCEVKRIMRVAEEVLTLTQMVDAIARSRLSAGLLYVPDEISFADDETDETAEEGDQADPFTKALMEHMAAPVEDRESAAALVPLVLRGPAELADKIVLIDLARQLDTWAQTLRQEALSRLAQGLDAPPEMMTGLGVVNHWGSFQIDADFASKHIAPLGELLAEFLTFAYLRPMLETFENVAKKETARYRLRFDLSAIAARADEAATGQRLHSDGLISDEVHVKTSGFAESDMPGEDEVLQRRMWRLIMSAPTVFGPVLLTKIPGFEDVDVSKLGSAPSGGLPGGGMGGLPGPTQDAQTGQEPPRTPVPGFSSADDALVFKLTIAADSQLDRALEKAGSRVLARTAKNGELMTRLRSLPKWTVLQHVGREELAALGRERADHSLTLTELFKDAWEPFSSNACGWIADYLVESGVSKEKAMGQAASMAAALTIALEEFAKTHCHDRLTSHGRAGVRVPEELVLQALGFRRLTRVV